MPHAKHAVSASLEDVVQHALEHVAHLLPDQAPIRVFIHHNTLHAFQHLHFHEAVLRAHDVYGAEPYVSEVRFREELARSRITARDVDAALDDQYPTEDRPLLGGALTLRSLRRLLMLHGLRSESSASLRWLLQERQVASRLRADVSPDARQRLLAQAGPGVAAEAEVSTALWLTCLGAVTGYSRSPGQREGEVSLHRDLLRETTGADAYDLLFPALIRLCAAYLDDGLAHWSMPHRELGFYAAVRKLAAESSSAPLHWVQEAHAHFRAQLERGATPLQVVAEVLDELGVRREDAGIYLEKLLLSLPGWAGMMSRLERQREEKSRAIGVPSLLEFLAVRITYERAALLDISQRKGAALRSLRELYKRAEGAVRTATPEAQEQVAYRLFQVAQLAGIPQATLAAQPRAAVHALLRAIDEFDAFARRRVFQEAYEHHHRSEVLSAIAQQRPHARLGRPHQRVLFQLVSCFDEREESLRRQVEEVAKDCETFGAPGFFGAAIRFHGIDEPEHVPLAPVVIQPTHLIEERPRESDLALHAARVARRKRWARLSRQLQQGSRSLGRGMLLNVVFGLVALFPLLTRVLSPRLAGRVKRFFHERYFPSPRTELTVHHDAGAELPAGVSQRGFKLDERVTRVATVLENIGFTSAFSQLVVVLGHGSTTLNNPHKSAYDCGACGGRQGGPNARVFCRMANDPDVRKGLAGRGIHIPSDTWFIGGQHDTCSDAISLLDGELVPESHRELLQRVCGMLDEARARNAQERCRRLFSAPKNPSPRQALRHVEARADHLAEPRPEFGHATNAVAVVGRRGLTRGLFMDRRAFLISYDPTIDGDGKILERTLAAATPVGAGINLEYYFSHVDNERYGAGSKLPHNVTALLGVMSGHASDLRTGLPRQMIEIHEPVRLLVIVEATPERLLDIAARQPEVEQLVVNRWVQLVSLHPETGAMQVFTDRGFVPFLPDARPLPEAVSSRDFYLGHTGFLPPARIVDSAA